MAYRSRGRGRGRRNFNRSRRRGRGRRGNTRRIGTYKMSRGGIRL